MGAWPVANAPRDVAGGGGGEDAGSPACSGAAAPAAPAALPTAPRLAAGLPLSADRRDAAEQTAVSSTSRAAAASAIRSQAYARHEVDNPFTVPAPGAPAEGCRPAKLP